jgi:protein subunit release factor B
MFPVSPEKQHALHERMTKLGVRDEDLEEAFVRSGGKGGQNVNKVATCVVLRHVPSGTTVKCQEARTQAMNRFLARRRLCDVLEAAREGRASARQQAIERLRRQKRKRSKRAKEKILTAKHARAEVKALRRSPGSEEHAS